VGILDNLEAYLELELDVDAPLDQDLDLEVIEEA
jgi:hypothetical protein